MKKITRLIYTGLLGVGFLISSPIMIKQVLKESPDTKAEATSIPYQPPAETEPAEPSETQPEETETLSEEETAETVQDTPEISAVFVKSELSYFDDALFIGDSRMENFRDYGTLNNADYLCSSDLSADMLLNDSEIDDTTFSEKISSAEYGKIYLMFGLHQAGDGAEDFRKNMTQVLNRIQNQQPDAVIYLMANLHVSTQESNENINALNQALQELADNEKIFYLDANPLFDDENGCLPEDVSEDGIHPDDAYYPQWCDWICEHTITPESKMLALPSLNFGQAVENVKNGKRVSRKSWENNTWLELHQEINVFSIQLHSENNQFSQWSASQEDMLADDWYLVEAVS